MEHPARDAVASLIGRLDQLLAGEPSRFPLVRLDVPVPAVDLLSWLACQPSLLGKKAYWSDREGSLAMAGLGAAWSYPLNSSIDINPAFQAVRALMLRSNKKGNGTKCFSYLSFSDHPAKVWPEFGYGQVWLPLVELSKTRKGYRLACNLYMDADGHWRRCIPEIQSYLLQYGLWQTNAHEKPGRKLFMENYSLLDARYAPSQKQWGDIFQHALCQLGGRYLDKVVLSRETCLPFEGHLSPWLVMQHWQLANTHSYSFLFEGSNDQYFLGCSPERLLKRSYRMVKTEALAGTTIRGKNRVDDQAKAVALMNDKKNIHENQLVLKDITSRLAPLCKWLESDRTHSIVKLKNIQHLRYLIRGVLKENVMDEDLVTLLHPTPAVGGTPRKEALRFISDNEPYARGLYAGACGLLGVGTSELAVSIRSARVAPNLISLYSGAGIVSGSSPDSEWCELNNKVSTIQGVLTSLQQISSAKEKCP